MTDRLRETASAYLTAVAEEAAAKQAVEAARAKRRAAGEKVTSTRSPLADAIVNAARKGVRQRDILAAINGAYTRERVRQICRAAGVEPAE